MARQGDQPSSVVERLQSVVAELRLLHTELQAYREQVQTHLPDEPNRERAEFRHLIDRVDGMVSALATLTQEFQRLTAADGRSPGSLNDDADRG